MKKRLLANKVRQWVIWTRLPDGINFFLGIKEIKLPTVAGTAMPMNMNIWGDITDLKDHDGIFTREEADFFNSLIQMDGIKITTLDEAKKVWEKEVAELRGKMLN